MLKKDRPFNQRILREATKLHEEAQGAYLMTADSFTQNAKDWSAGKSITLYVGNALVRLNHSSVELNRF
ncbi:MAG TPA: restriction endonuclease [Brevefilum sp.]|nr:restriction endonuclease [Brevefilum sp.]HOR19071.1 restriction endonuclease [Brevefilum sp.]HPL68941.1 restriction endonuclease [Brevefilum sp.]